MGLLIAFGWTEKGVNDQARNVLLSFTEQITPNEALPKPMEGLGRAKVCSGIYLPNYHRS